MREIKFRVRDLEENKFIDLSDLIITFDNCGIEIYRNCGMTLDNYEMNQYTGLKDVNGVDIYEGDIVRDNSISDDKDYNYLIIFECGAFITKWAGTFDNYLYEYALDGKLEIIGNIYKNSDLL